MKNILVGCVCFTLFVCSKSYGQAYLWDQLASPSAQFRYNDVFFISPKIGWTIHPYSPFAPIDPKPLGVIYKTTNGGTTWIKQLDNIKNHFRSIAFSDAMHGWVFSLGVTKLDPPDDYDTTLIYATTDGGVTWTPEQDNIVGPLPDGICGSMVVDSTTVFACGRFTGPAFIIKTTDKGKTWNSQNMSEHAGMLIDCHFWSRDSGIVVGGTSSVFDSSSALILFTSDGGTTWSERYRGERKGEWFWKISFPTENVGYISFESIHAPTHGLKTTDKGVSWQDMPISNGQLSIQGIGFVNEKVGWVGGYNMKALETKDGGQTWNETSITNNINRFRFFGDTLGYASGNRIAKMERFGQVSVDASSKGELTHTEVTPNPFTTETEIRFSLAKSDHVTIKIFNTIGIESALIVDEYLDAGSYVFNIGERTNLPSGVYHCIIRAGKQLYRMQMVRL